MNDQVLEMFVDEVDEKRKVDGKTWVVKLKPAKKDVLPTWLDKVGITLTATSRPPIKEGELVDFVMKASGQTKIDVQKEKNKKPATRETSLLEAGNEKRKLDATTARNVETSRMKAQEATKKKGLRGLVEDVAIATHSKPDLHEMHTGLEKAAAQPAAATPPDPKKKTRKKGGKK